MYIGSTSERGLHHLVYEIVDNSIDEALAGYCKNIDVTINEDDSITVIDDGRGIPVGINHKAGIPAVEVVFTILHAGGKFGGGGYKVSGGLHGVGASVVNALSDWLEVTIHTDGKKYKQRYERGKVMYPLKEIGTTDRTGTEVTFKPDGTIFTETLVYDFDIIKTRLREMAFLTKGVSISLTDKREGKEQTKTFYYEGGIKECFCLFFTFSFVCKAYADSFCKKCHLAESCFYYIKIIYKCFCKYSSVRFKSYFCSCTVCSSYFFKRIHYLSSFISLLIFFSVCYE